MYSYGPPHMAGQKQDDNLEHTSSSYVKIRDVALKTCRRRWTIGGSGERGSGISVPEARHDDDDDDDFLPPRKTGLVRWLTIIDGRWSRSSKIILGWVNFPSLSSTGRVISFSNLKGCLRFSKRGLSRSSRMLSTYHLRLYSLIDQLSADPSKDILRLWMACVLFTYK